MITVLIVDDQPLVRAGLRVLLEAEPDIEVVAEYVDAAKRAGASRVLLKDEAPDVLAGAVRTLVDAAPC